MREKLVNFLGICTNIDPSDLKPDYSPDCSDVYLSKIGEIVTRDGVDKIYTTSKDNPIYLIDQIENDGVVSTVIIQSTQMETI